MIGSYDVLILGSGGAGMMCAIEAGKRGRRVALLDHSRRVGGKILISGGGRCNFTNIGASPTQYVSKNPHFCKSAIYRYSPADFISLVKKHGVPFHEKKLGQLFCDASAQAIVDLLVAECLEARADFIQDCHNTEVLKNENGAFEVKNSRGDFTGSALVVATGGLSLPKLGATGLGYEIARQFGIPVTETAPALDGFVFSEAEQTLFEGLAGVSFECSVSCNGVAFQEGILFTHSGLSGPGALQASLHWNPGDEVTIDFVPDTDIGAWLIQKKKEKNNSELKNLLSEFLPKHFTERFCSQLQELSSFRSLSDTKDNTLRELGRLLSVWKFVPKGTVGYSKAEVTRGGVDTNALSSQTMEAKNVPGLYFIGEVVDVTGWLGGYNFQWAWASGWSAGQVV